MEQDQDGNSGRQTNPDFNFKSLIPCVKSKSKKDKKEQETKSDTWTENTDSNTPETAVTIPIMDSTDSQSGGDLVKSGVCILICNGEFANAPERKNMWWDGRLAMEVFENLGFKIVYLFNKSSKELVDSLKKVCNGEEYVGSLEHYDCLVVVISSHGSENQTVSDNENVKRYVHTISTKDGIVETDRIVQCFDACRPLTGKPKLFFIQACRGRFTDSSDRFQFTDPGVEVEVKPTGLEQKQIESFNKSISSQDAVGAMPETFVINNKRYDDHTAPTPQPEDIVEAVITPCYTDCLLMFASPSGKFAWSDYYKGNEFRKQGGWLLMCLHSKLMSKIKEGQSFEILEVLTEVCQEMAQNYETAGNTDARLDELVSVPCISHMLREDVYFKPKKT